MDPFRRSRVLEKLAGVDLKVPIHRQTTKWTCGPSCAREVLLYYGIDVPEMRLAQMMRATSKDGTDPDDIVRVLNQQPGISASANTLTIQQLLRHLRAGHPVIVDLQAWSDRKEPDYRNARADGHYAVLRGVEGDRLYFSDPSSTKPTHITVQELEDRWHDVKRDGSRIHRLGIVVRGPTQPHKRTSMVPNGSAVKMAAMSD